VSEFRFEKERVTATLTLAPGRLVDGSFFLAAHTSIRSGRERVGDLLNGQTGFFPFELRNGNTVLYNRAHLVVVALEPPISEAERDLAYDTATHRRVSVVLSTGMHVEGTVAVYGGRGHDRLSDYARTPEPFHYLETRKNTLLVNAAHIVELTDFPD